MTHLPPATADDLDMIVSFVLYRTPQDEIVRAVEQVRRSDVRAHVVLVDNSVPPLALPDFDPAFVTVIQTGENLGYGRGHNRAIGLGRGRARHHVVMNTDVTYAPDALGRLLAFMEAHPQAGLAMPNVRYPDGRQQYLCRLLPHPLDIFVRGFVPGSTWARRRSARYEFRDWTYDRVENFPFLSGCFMVLRGNVLDRVQGFDERFFLYAEDIDLSRRIHLVAETLFVPDVHVTHEYRTQTTRSLKRFLVRFANFARYFRKWGWFGDSERDAINRRTRDRVYGGGGASR